jgi:hypothetical protein
MEMDMKDDLGVTLDRLAAAASLLEQTVERLGQTQSLSAEAIISRIVATVESRREMELEEKLAAAEARIAELQARGASSSDSGRKTMPSAITSLLTKQGVTIESIEGAGALDAALVSLSLEQRIAVKAQLMRAGLLG